MKKIQVNIREEKGASAILVLLTVLTFICILTGIFAIVMTRASGQIKSDLRIQEIYGNDVERADEIYEEIVGNYTSLVNWRNLINELGINASNYNSFKNALFDSNNTATIIADSDCQNYILNNNVLLNDINENSTVKEVFLSNESIMRKLRDKVTVTSNEQVGLVPTLTSNTTTSDAGVTCGVASQSSYWYTAQRQAYAAFNGNVTTNNINNCWQATSNASSTGTYIRYQSTTKDTILRARVGTWNDCNNYEGKTWTTFVRGSNDGTNWTKISEAKVLTVLLNEIKYFDYVITDFRPYQYYEVYFEAQSGDDEYVMKNNSYACCFMYLQFYGLKDGDILQSYLNSLNDKTSDYIYETDEELDLRNMVGVTLESSTLSNNKLNASFSERSGGYEGLNLKLSNFTVGKKYKLKFKFKSSGEYYPDSGYGAWFGYKLSDTEVASYNENTGYHKLEKSSTYKEYEIIFTASQTTKYLVFNVAGFSDGTTNHFDIGELEISEYAYIKKDGIDLFSENSNAVDIVNTVGVTVLNSNISNQKGTMSFSENSAGYEGCNIKLSNLIVGENYRVTFKFKSSGEYYPENSYGRIFGYKVSATEVTDYSDYTDYTTLQKSTEYVSYSIDFTATENKEYLAFDVAGFSDATTNYFDIDELYITTIY